jgi:aryl-alcohol dehydrogenase-like predicted oxidoreductase
MATSLLGMMPPFQETEGSHRFLGKTGEKVFPIGLGGHHIGRPKESSEGIRIIVVPKLVEQGIAVLGMKPMGDGNLLKSGKVTAVECLHYALSLPTSVVITGCESMDRLDQAIKAARTFRPMTPDQTMALLAKTKIAAASGNYEPFKTTSKFDGTAQHPEWMG